MAQPVIKSLYLGSGKEGLENEQTLSREATKHKMNLSQFVLYCVEQTLRLERKVLK